MTFALRLYAFPPHSSISRGVVGSLGLGLVAAVVLIAWPLAGAREHSITAAVLVSSACSWLLLASRVGRITREFSRSALRLAGFMGAMGLALWLFAPGDAVLDALGWVWPAPFLMLVGDKALQARRHLPGRTRAWVVYPLLAAYAAAAVGGAAQTFLLSRERGVVAAPGRLVDIGGRRLHLVCAGAGSPTVILESGLGQTASYWAWITGRGSHDARVCAYDRAGRGWSDDGIGEQDGTTVARDLHALLDRADEDGPYVLVGHSSGAQYVRTFAGLYPTEVAGVVLLDGQPAEAFSQLPAFPMFYTVFHRVYAVLPTLGRLGVARVLIHEDASLPASMRAAERANRVSARYYRSVRDEFVALPAALAAAGHVRTLGDRPLIVITAGIDSLTGWIPLQQALATLSHHSRHRVVPATHNALVADRYASREASDAIHEVVEAVRSGTPFVD